MQNITTPKTKIQINSDNSRVIVSAFLAQMVTQRGRDVQRQGLDKIARLASGGRIESCLLFPWHLLKYEHTQAIKSRLVEIYKPSTVNRILSALRGVLRAAWRVGVMSADEYQRAADIKSVSNTTLPTGREISRRELALLFAACAVDTSAAGVRDFALLAILYGCGLRRAEIAWLNLSDYEKDACRLRVKGKREKERYAYLPAGAVSALSAWLELRGDCVGGLFLRVDKSGRIIHKKNMTGQAVYTILARRAAAVGVSDLSPHDLRRTFVSNLLDNGNDLSVVSKMAGHSSVQTTARYDRREDETKKRAANGLYIPSKDGVICQ